MLTEGWLLPRADQRLAQPIKMGSVDKYGQAPGAARQSAPILAAGSR